MTDKESNVVLNFKMDGQVEYAKTIRDINAIMNAAASEYKTHVAAMDKDASATTKLAAEKKKLEVQLEAGRERTAMLRKEYEAMANDTNTSTGALANKYKQLQNSERAELSLEQALDRVNEGLSEQSEEARKNEEALNKLESEAGELEGQTEKLNAEYELQVAQLGENASESDKLSAKMDHLNDVHELAGEKVKNYEEQLEIAKQQYGENSEEANEYEVQLLEARTAEQELANEIDATNKQLQEQEDVLKKTGEQLGKAGEKMKDTGKNLSKKVTVPIMGAAAAATKIGMDFESSMSEMAAISGATGDDLQQLEDKAREMGATTNKSATEAADAMGYMALAGWDNQQMMEGIEPVLKLSSAGNIDLAHASDLVTDSMSAMGIEVDQLEDYLDVMTATSQNSNTEIDELGEAFITAGGKLRDLGIDFNEGAVALGLMADEGIKGSEAGRGLSAILTNLTSPTGQAKKAIEELGISFFDANGDFIGVEESLKLVDGALDGMTQEQQAMYKSMIAGKEHSSTFSALMNGLGDDFDNLSDDIDNSKGALDEMYDVMTDNLKGEIDTLTSGLSEAGIAIFKNLQPALESIVGYLQKAVEWFNNLSPTMQNTIMVIGGIAAAIGPVLVVLGTLASSLSSLIGLIPILGTAFTVLTGPVGIVIAIIGLLVAAGVALYKNWDTIKEKSIEVFMGLGEFFSGIFERIIGIFESSLDWIDEVTGGKFKAITDVIRENMQNSLELLKDIWSFIKDTFKNAIDLIKALVKGDFEGMKKIMKNQMDNAKKILSKIWTTIKENTIDRILEMLSAVKKRFTEIKDNIKEKITQAKDALVQKFTEMVTNAINKAKEIVTNVKNKFTEVKNAVTNKLTEAKTALVNKFTEMVTNATNKAADIVTSVRDKFVEVKNAIRDKLTEAVTTVGEKVGEMPGKAKEKAEDMVSAGKDLISGMITGIKGMAEDAIEAISGVVGGVVDKAKSLLKIKSPSRVFKEIGEHTVQGLVDGIGNNEDEGASVTERLLNFMKEEVKRKVEALRRESVRLLVRFLEEWIDIIEEIRQGTKDEFSIMKTDLYLIGEQSIQGMINGLEAMRPALMAKARSIANEMSSIIASAMDTPSLNTMSIDVKPKGTTFTQPSQFGETGKTVNNNSRSVYNNDSSRNITQNLTINSPKPTSPSENARKMKQASRQLAMEW